MNDFKTVCCDADPKITPLRGGGYVACSVCSEPAVAAPKALLQSRNRSVREHVLDRLVIKFRLAGMEAAAEQVEQWWHDLTE